MSWNYRVIKRVYKGEPSFQIHEVYYNDEGDRDGWSADPMAPCGQTAKELTEDLMLMRMALKKPVLVEDGDKLQEA